ncbi:MAG: DUF1569 domain-containing protein [Bacteroidota bacterium]
MSFANCDLESFLAVLCKLEESSSPEWGNMSAQRMVEHLTDGINMSMGIGDFQLEIPEDRISKMVQFLDSDKPMAQNIQVSFAKPETPLRNADLDDAIDEFTLAWVDFEELYENQPAFSALHPYYGNLNFEQWIRLHSKHFTHHFNQFGLI